MPRLPVSALGVTRDNGDGTYDLVAGAHDLVSVRVDGRRDGRVDLEIDNFFWQQSPEAMAAARRAAGRRTVAGLGMAWVRAVARRVGAVLVTISEDSWVGRGGITSPMLKADAAEVLALGRRGCGGLSAGATAALRRAHRVHARPAGAGCRLRRAERRYLERVAADGFYGGFGFTDAKEAFHELEVGVSSLVRLHAGFCDRAV
jgi:hypothetical protein